MKRKVIIFLIIILSIIIPTNISYSNEDITMKEQQDEFKIQDFISNSKKYTGDFFNNVWHGEGQLENYETGDLYHGEFENGYVLRCYKNESYHLKKIFAVAIATKNQKLFILDFWSLYTNKYTF